MGVGGTPENLDYGEFPDPFDLEGICTPVPSSFFAPHGLGRGFLAHTGRGGTLAAGAGSPGLGIASGGRGRTWKAKPGPSALNTSREHDSRVF